MRFDPIILYMRKFMMLSEAKFSTPEVGWWNKTMQRLSDIPECGISIGEEIGFAGWLSKQHIQWIIRLTEDELSRYLSGEQRDLGVFRQRAPAEDFILKALAMPPAPMSPTVLEKYAMLSNGVQKQSIRTYRHFSSPDRKGARQEFVSPSDLPTAIGEFCDVWNGVKTGIQKPIAIWLFVALLNAHPFGDGNGRLARALLNVKLANDGLLAGKSIPLGPLIYATQGNFELAMGRAAIMNNWEPILRVFYLLVDFYAEVFKDFERSGRNDSH